MKVIHTTSLENGGTLVWSNSPRNISVYIDVDGQLNLFKVLTAKAGSEELPPGDYVVKIAENECVEDEGPDIASYPDEGATDPALVAAIEELGADQEECCDKLKQAIDDSAELQVEAAQMAAEEEQQAIATQTTALTGATEQQTTQLSMLESAIATAELNAKADQTAALVEAIEAIDSTDDDYDHQLVAVQTHCLDGDEIKTVFKRAVSVEDDNGDAPVLDVLGYIISGEFATDLPEDAEVGPCCCPQYVEVHTCGWNYDPTGWDVRWWYGEDAMPITHIEPPETNMDSQQLDMDQSFTLGQDGASTDQPYTERMCGYYSGTDGVVSDTRAQGYEPAVHNSLPSHNIRQGWVRIPVSEETAWFQLHDAAASSSALFVGYTEEQLAEVARNVSYDLNITRPIPDGTYEIQLSKADAEYVLGGHWYVFVQTATSDPTGTSINRIQYAYSDHAWMNIPKSEVGCNLPVLSDEARFEEAPYVFQDGEQPSACVNPIRSTATIAGIDYETCQASSDGRTIKINTETGVIYELDGTQAPDGTECSRPEGECTTLGSGTINFVDGLQSIGEAGETVTASLVYRWGTYDVPNVPNIAAINGQHVQIGYSATLPAPTELQILEDVDGVGWVYHVTGEA